jgi:hypothetical protein
MAGSTNNQHKREVIIMSSNECPKFFVAAMFNAATTHDSYASAGYELGRHIDDLVDDHEVEGLEEAQQSEQATVWSWIESALPRCAALVPEVHREEFTEGFMRAVVEAA